MSNEQTGRGGARPGAGRPPGSHTALATAARRKAKESGMLPHEILLDMARGNPQTLQVVTEDGSVVSKQVSLTLDERRDAAKAAAPYYAPKISTVEVIAGVSDADLDEFIARAAAETGLSIGASGEGAQGQDQAPARGSKRRAVVNW